MKNQKFSSLIYAISAIAPLSLGACKARSYRSTDAVTNAAFSTAQTRGRATTTFQSPSGITEKCISTNHFPGIKYDEDDVKTEDKLCSLNFYKTPETATDKTAVALCPKMSSTFPGVEVYELGGKDKNTYETNYCKNQDGRPTSRLAKFKQSVSCCYTGSILGYYHLSRIMGDAANVPTAVIRTMDIAQHKIIANRGVNWSSDLNQSLWKQVLGYDAAPKQRDNYFSSDLKTVFGAMSENPAGEERYAEINQNYADPATSRANFLARPIVQRIFDSQSVSAIAQRNLASAAPIIQQMKDISDLVVMDYIMQQQDRFGNIHYQDYYYYITSENKIEHKKIKREGNSIITPKPAPDAVIVKRLLLKDNDCGSRIGNLKAFTLDEVKKIRHMSARSYKGIRYLANAWQNGSAKSFFQSEALLNTPDALDSTGIEDFGKRIVAASNALYANCKAGALLLDLSIADHLASTNTAELVKQQCDATLTPDSSEPSTTVPAVEPQPNPSTNSEPTQPEAPSFKEMNCRVNSNDGTANVRKSAGGEIYMTLNNGASVKAVSMEGDWYSVEYRLNQIDHGERNGRPAWIHKSVLACN